MIRDGASTGCWIAWHYYFSGLYISSVTKLKLTNLEVFRENIVVPSSDLSIGLLCVIVYSVVRIHAGPVPSLAPSFLRITMS